MNLSDALIWFVILIELILCIMILVVLFKVMRGIHININVNHPPLPEDKPVPPSLDTVQKQLDELEADRRKGEQQLVDLIGTINQFMTGGNDNAK